MSVMDTVPWSQTRTNPRAGHRLVLILERLALGAFITTIALLGFWIPIPLALFSQSWVVSNQYHLVTLFHPYDHMVILYPSDLSASFTVAFWLLGRLAAILTGQARSALRFGPRTLLLPLMGLAALTALSATQAILPILSLESALQLCILAALIFAILNLRPSLWMITVPLACLLAIEGVLSLFQVWAQSTLVDRLLLHYNQEITPSQSFASVVQLPGGVRWLRAYGTLVHPNILGGFLCLALPLVAGAYLRLRWRKNLTWLLLAALGLGLLALLLSFSRAAWLALIIGTLWAGWMSWSRWRTTQVGTAPPHKTLFNPATYVRLHVRPILLCLLGVGVLAGLVITLGPMLQTRLLLNSSPLEQRSVSERVVLFEASAVFISEHPWLGVGAGNMPLLELTYPPTQAIGEPTHNVPVLIATETGVLGLLLWLIPPMSILWVAWRRRLVLSPAALAAATALLALLIAAQLDHYLWTLSPGNLLWWLAITLTSLWSGESKEVTRP